MKIERIQGMNGKWITQYIPETDEDLEILYRMEREGKLDARHSFADGQPRKSTKRHEHRRKKKP